MYAGRSILQFERGCQDAEGGIFDRISVGASGEAGGAQSR